MSREKIDVDACVNLEQFRLAAGQMQKNFEELFDGAAKLRTELDAAIAAFRHLGDAAR